MFLKSLLGMVLQEPQDLGQVLRSAVVCVLHRHSKNICLVLEGMLRVYKEQLPGPTCEPRG